MANPPAIFDQTIIPVGWFDETIQPIGWFDGDFLNVGSAPAEGYGEATATGTASGSGYVLHYGFGESVATTSVVGQGYNLHYGYGSATASGSALGEGLAPTGAAEGSGIASATGSAQGEGYRLSYGSGEGTTVGSAQGQGDNGAEPVVEQNSGGWLRDVDFRRGRDEYIRRKRIAMGILPADAPESPVISRDAERVVSEVAQRQTGLRMSTQDREADLARELQAREMEWQQEYSQALYAELYRVEMQRREDDLIVALLAA